MFLEIFHQRGCRGPERHPRAMLAAVCSLRVDCFACDGMFLKEEFIAKVTCQQIFATSLPSRRWNQLKVGKKIVICMDYFFFFS